MATAGDETATASTNENASEAKKASETKAGAKKYRHKAKDFDFESTLGDGAFSKVVVGKVVNEASPHYGNRYAVKVMDKRHIVKNDKIKYVNIEREVFVATKSHPFVCHMHFSFQDSYSLYFALDLCSDETLSYLIYKYLRLKESLTIIYMSEIVSVLEFMHEKGIYHRDIKPENILIHSDGHIRVTDFGTCKITSNKSDKDNENESNKKPKKDRKQSFVGTALYVLGTACVCVFGLDT